MRATKLFFLCVCVAGLALVGCGDDGTVTDAGTDSGTGTDSGMGTDSGTGTDSGRPMDAGPADPCEAGGEDAISTVGCNGGLYGSTPMANEIGGECTPDSTTTDPAPGTCTAGPSGSMAFCNAEEGADVGQCLHSCTAGSDYVSTGGCPTGARCFNLGEVAVCFRDCNSAADCFAGEECDGEGSCVQPPSGDGGVPDAGSDAGTGDAGTGDAGTP